MYTIGIKSPHDDLATGFTTFRERGRGRYDMQIKAYETPEFDFLRSGPWLPMVHAILGPSARLIHSGCFLSLPESDIQDYHTDGVHLNGDDPTHLPPHALNLFINLVELTKQNGGTEFSIGSHVKGRDGWNKVPPAHARPTHPARPNHRPDHSNQITATNHRRLPPRTSYFPLVYPTEPEFSSTIVLATAAWRIIATSQGALESWRTPLLIITHTPALLLTSCHAHPRPVLYLSFSTTNKFSDNENFSRSRYRKLPELCSKPASRKERGARKRGDTGSAAAGNGANNSGGASSSSSTSTIVANANGSASTDTSASTSASNFATEITRTIPGDSTITQDTALASTTVRVGAALNTGGVDGSLLTGEGMS